MYRMQGIYLAIVALLLVGLPVFASAQTNQGFAKHRILLLYSYHPTFPTVPQVLSGMLSEFGDQPPVVEVEYMDSKRLHTKRSIELFAQNLEYKLSAREPYDVVVTADDNALHFMLDKGKRLFPNIPIVFLGVNNLGFASSQEPNPLVTGVVEATSLKETIEVASELFPQTEMLHVITDGTTSGASDLNSVRKLQSSFPNLPFSIINLAQESWDSVAHQLKQVPKTDAVLLLSAYRDRDQESLSFEKSLEVIMASSIAPIFHPYEHGIGDGIIGGVVISHEEQARQATKKVKQILSGTSVKDIPILDQSPNIFKFDKRQLDRFGISISDLPSDAKILFLERSLFRIYWKEITIVAIVMGMLVLIILMQAHQGRVRLAFSRSLEESESRLRTILNSIDAYVYMKNSDGHYLFVNKLMSSLFNLPAEALLSKTDRDLFDDDVAKERGAIDKQVMAAQRLHRQHGSIWNPQLEARQELDMTRIPLVNEHGETYALCGVSFDITDHVERERRLQQMANYDQLTGLPNRVLFSDRLTQAMKQVKRNNSTISVLFLDLDGFKEVNDTFDHTFGDELLKEVSERINQSIRSNDTAARLGGDEFVILLIDAGAPQYDLEITQRILNAVSAPMLINQVPVSVSASIGITRYPQAEALEADQLLRQADQAMYIAKNMGRNRYHFFDLEVEKAGLQREVLISDIKRALKENQFELHYQPKVRLADGDVVGVEALLRWRHPQKGLLPPAAFLPGVEKHSVMMEIDNWVIGRALEQLRDWLNEEFPMPISVNLSHMFFKQRDLAGILKRKLDAYPDIPARMISFEVLETQALPDLQEVAVMLRECQELGIGFALDDFGTGFSSLTYLKQLPIDMLKVDRSFVINMLEDEEDRSILKGIMALCQTFNIMVIAEGVETIRHGVELKKMGYHFAQGYGIAKPMPGEKVSQWAEGWTEPKEWKETVLPTGRGADGSTEEGVSVRSAKLVA